MSLPALFTFTITAVGTVSGAPTANIVGGTPTTAFSGSVAIGAISGSQGAVFCSATVVAEGWAVTAAHCLDDGKVFTDAGWTLYAFEANDLLREGILDSATFASTHVPADYPAASYDADIALIELSNPLGEPIPLLEGDIDESWTGQALTFVGFGYSSSGAQDPGVKRLTEIPIETVKEKVLVTYDPSSNVCNADSGASGLVSDGEGGWLLASVPVYVSPASPCAGGRGGSVRVDVWRGWMNETMGVGEGGDTGPVDSGSQDSGPHDSGPGDPADTGDGGEEPKGRCSSLPGRSAPGALGLLGLAALLATRRRQA